MKKICITGHRELLNSKNVRKNISYSLQYFKTLYTDIETFSAMAAGSDTLFAEEAIKQSMPVTIILPFALEEYKKDFTEPDLKKLNELLANHTYKIAQELITYDQDEKNNAYLLTGQQMVDNADIVLAVWDGNPTRGTGGTGDIIRYARAIRKELHIIKGIRPQKHGEEKITDEVQEAFDKWDTEAIKYKKRRFEPAWIAGIITGVLAVFSFTAGLALTLSSFSKSANFHAIKFMLAAGEVIILSISIILLSKYARKWKNEFLKYRRGAEYLRTVLWYKDAGIPIPQILQPGYTPEKEILDIEEKIMTNITAINNFSNSKRIAWCLAKEQMDYHQNIRILPFTEKTEIMEKWLKFIKLIFFIVMGANFLTELYEYGHFHFLGDLMALQPWLIFFWIVLPPVYAALEGIKYFGEWKRNINLSNTINRELKKFSNRILACADETGLLAETKNLRIILEMENSDWAIRYKEKEVESKM